MSAPANTTSIVTEAIGHLHSLDLKDAVLILLLAVAAAIIIRYVVLPLLKYFSATSILNAAKMFKEELTGQRGTLGVINMLSFIILAVISLMIYRGESGASLISILIPNKDPATQSFPLCFFLCFLTTIGVLVFSMYLLYKIEQRQIIKKGYAGRHK